MIRKMFFLAFTITGWVLAAYFFNVPTGNPHFTDQPATDALFDSGPRKIVEWHEGRYELFQNGVERVTPHWGSITLAFDPGRGHCPQGIIVYADRIAYQYCYEGKVGGAGGHREDLSSKAERILQKGRTLAERHWELTIAHR